MKSKSTIMLLLISFIACDTQSKKSQEQYDIVKSDSHTSQNSLDWMGVYSGTMPCADCEGIKTEIKLNDNLTYSLTTQLLSKSDGILRETGKFEWNDDGSAISLQMANDQTEFHQYKVVENALVKLDKNGEMIESELSNKYRLEKD